MLPTEQNRCVRLGPPLNGIMSIAGDTLRLTAFGKTHWFSWHNYLGPCFETKTGKDMKRFPGERNPWWKGFALWERQGKRTEGGVCLWDAGTTCERCRGKGRVTDKAGPLNGLPSPCPVCHGEGVTHTVPTEPWRGR